MKRITGSLVCLLSSLLLTVTAYAAAPSGELRAAADGLDLGNDLEACYDDINALHEAGVRVFDTEGLLNAEEADDLEEKLARPEVTALILCSPHNPVGRVWAEAELRRLGDLCLRHHVLVISDEIHNDLIHRGHRHTVYAALGEEYAANCVIGTACSKTFSLAGLCCANMLVPDPEKRRALAAEIDRSGCYTHSSFGTLALEVGYEQCGDWLDQLLDYVYGNYEYLRDFLSRHFPAAWLAPLEGTYLAWADLRCLGENAKERAAFLENEAQLYLSHGAPFGAPGFERINLACARPVLAAALDRLLAAARRNGLA